MTCYFSWVILMSAAISIITAFGHYSRLHINWWKSELLPVDTVSPSYLYSIDGCGPVQIFRNSHFSYFEPLYPT